jgi:hypothetical protein
LSPATGKVILGDGKTSLPILGVGTVTCTIGSQIVNIENVRYVPTLSESIYSLFIHVQLPNLGLKSSFDQGLFLEFPTFQTKAIIGKSDLFLDALLLPENITKQQSSTTVQYSNEVCCHISNFQQDVLCETDHLDHLLFSLRQYYATIKTKRQLQLGTPAGFRQLSQHQKLYLMHGQNIKSLDDEFLSSTSSDTATFPEDSSFTIPLNTDVSTSTLELLDESLLPPNTNLPQHTAPIPLIRSVDKPASSLPIMITVSEDFLRASMGFRWIDTVKRHFPSLYSNNLCLDSTLADAVLDQGVYATLHKKARNTTPVPRSECFGDVMNMDIVFGPEVALGNIHYGLMFTDRYSRMGYIYPLQNLTTDIPKSHRSFLCSSGICS